MKRIAFVSAAALLLLLAALFVPWHRVQAQGGQTINLNMKQTALVGFTVTDNTGAAVPTGGYSVTSVVADPTVVGVGSNPTILQPLKQGSTTVTWTVTGKGTYSGTETLGPDTVNVTTVPLASATVTYTVQ